MSNKTSTDTPTERTTAPAEVFTANLQAVNLMQQRVFCTRAQAVDDPLEQKRLLESSQKITDIIREVIG